MNKFESASIIAGILPNSEEQATAPTNVHMITGEVVERSEDGKALIDMDGVVFSGDDSQYVEVDALGGLEEGDTAAILLSGETGKAMAPFALGSAGIIDRVRTTAEDADILAGEAWEVAESVGQHVWTDDDGLHVTEVPKEEFIVNPTGANQLMNANGTLIRDGETNRTASTPSGYAIYDGLGNLASNIVASFSGDSVVLGKSSDPHIDIRPLPDASTGAKAGLNFYHGGLLDISFNEQGICWYQGYVNGVTLSLYNILDEIKTDRQGMHLYAYSDPVEAIQSARIDLLATEGAISGSGTVKLTGGNLALSNQAGTSTTSMTMEKAIAMLTTSSANLSHSSAVSSWRNGTIYRSGKVVTVSVNDLKLASALNSGVTSASLATIPVGFRPPNTVRLAIAVNTAGNYGNAWVAIAAGGDIQIRNTSSLQIPTKSEISFTATYVIN